MARHAEETAASTAPKKSQEIVQMNEEDEEAIRAKLRQSGWDKKKLLKLKEGESASKDGQEKEDGDEKEKTEKKKELKDKDAKRTSTRDERDREEKDRRAGRSSRRSRSARRRDKDSDRDRDRDRRRDRDSGRGSSRRHRSRSVSKSRSRSTSVRRRDKDRDGRDRGRERSRRAEKRRSRSRSASVSRSRSASKSRTTKRSRTDEKKSERDEKKDVAVVSKEEKEEPQPTAAVETESTENKPKDTKEEETKGLDDRKSRKSSRHRSRSASRSPSRSSRHRRRRHRSPSRSRSASRSRRDRGRGRGGSRSRSRSNRRRSSRRRRSPSRSRSRSSYSRRRRSHSKDRGRRNANSSPSPGQHPPAAPAAVAVGGIPAVANPVNPTITQLMQQYPTMSLQDIIAKMQASNLTMAAAVSMKPARELYVGNLPPSITGPQLQEFLGTIIQQVGLTVQAGNPILSTWISTDGHFAFCEMRSIEECNLALMLNQLPLLGQPLKFGRPKSFMGPPQPLPVVSARTQTALANLGCTPNPQWFATPAIGDLSSVASMTASLTAAVPGYVAAAPAPLAVAPFAAPVPVPVAAPVVVTSNVAVSSNKLVMSNIPAVLMEDQVKELVQPFGELKSFELLIAPGQPTGSALFEYVDESVTDDAVKGLDGLELGPDPLVVRRAVVGEEETGPVLKLANMVSIDELKDDEEFSDLKEDVEEECKRFGSVVALEIPRPNNGQDVPGLGSIFVQFETTSQAGAALKALSGRKFGGNIVKVSYFPIAKLQQKDFA